MVIDGETVVIDGRKWARIGPWVIRRSDGFHSPWEPGTTEKDVHQAIQSAIQRALKDQELS